MLTLEGTGGGGGSGVECSIGCSLERFFTKGVIFLPVLLEILAFDANGFILTMACLFDEILWFQLSIWMFLSLFVVHVCLGD